MNIFFKEIQESFALLDNPKTKQSSFVTALEYMLKIADRSEHETETYTITTDMNGDIIIVMKSKVSQITITANARISYIGTDPKKKDHIHIINTDSSSVSNEVFEWIKRNKK